MNPTEQKRHTKRTDELATDITSLATMTVDAVDGLREAIGAERTHRLKLADEQRGYVDQADREIRRVADERWQATSDAQVKIIALSEPLRRRFFGRLRWLLVGR